jgi:hypothetical protein
VKGETLSVFRLVRGNTLILNSFSVDLLSKYIVLCRSA